MREEESDRQAKASPPWLCAGSTFPSEDDADCFKAAAAAPEAAVRAAAHSASCAAASLTAAPASSALSVSNTCG